MPTCSASMALAYWELFGPDRISRSVFIGITPACRPDRTGSGASTHPEIRKRAIADHYALLDALASDDVEKACQAQYDHIELPLKGVRAES